MPTLGELCAILPADVVLALELKTHRFLDPDVCRRLADALAAGVLDRTVALSFSLARVEAVAAAAPDLPKGFITMSKLTPRGVDAQLIGAFWPIYFLNPFYVRQAHGAGRSPVRWTRRRNAGCGITAGWGATRCWPTIPPRRSGRWRAETVERYDQLKRCE